MYDTDADGSLKTTDLRGALHAAGFEINNHIFGYLVLRYSREGQVKFDKFVKCCMKLRDLIGEPSAPDISVNNSDRRPIFPILSTSAENFDKICEEKSGPAAFSVLEVSSERRYMP